MPDDLFPPEERLWLTLYLSGHEQGYGTARINLEAEGWKNFDQSENYAGFAYPKKDVVNDETQIRTVLIAALQICDQADIDILLIDADTASDPSASTFYTLYQDR